MHLEWHNFSSRRAQGKISGWALGGRLGSPPSSFSRWGRKKTTTLPCGLWREVSRGRSCHRGVLFSLGPSICNQPRCLFLEKLPSAYLTAKPTSSTLEAHCLTWTKKRLNQQRHPPSNVRHMALEQDVPLFANHCARCTAPFHTPSIRPIALYNLPWARVIRGPTAYSECTCGSDNQKRRGDT